MEKSFVFFFSYSVACMSVLITRLTLRRLSSCVTPWCDPVFSQAARDADKAASGNSTAPYDLSLLDGAVKTAVTRDALDHLRQGAFFCVPYWFYVSINTVPSYDACVLPAAKNGTKYTVTSRIVAFKSRYAVWERVCSGWKKLGFQNVNRGVCESLFLTMGFAHILHAMSGTRNADWNFTLLSHFSR